MLHVTKGYKEEMNTFLHSLSKEIKLVGYKNCQRVNHPVPDW